MTLRLIIKLSDFGLAQPLELEESHLSVHGHAGTLKYMAPETVQPTLSGSRQLTRRVDIWAVGMMLFQMLHGGRTPFDRFFKKGDIEAAVAIASEVVHEDVMKFDRATVWAAECQKLGDEKSGLTEDASAVRPVPTTSSSHSNNTTTPEPVAQVPSAEQQQQQMMRRRRAWLRAEIIFRMCERCLAFEAADRADAAELLRWADEKFLNPEEVFFPTEELRPLNPDEEQTFFPAELRRGGAHAPAKDAPDVEGCGQPESEGGSPAPSAGGSPSASSPIVVAAPYCEEDHEGPRNGRNSSGRRPMKNVIVILSIALMTILAVGSCFFVLLRHNMHGSTGGAPPVSPDTDSSTGTLPLPTTTETTSSHPATSSQPSLPRGSGPDFLAPDPRGSEGPSQGQPRGSSSSEHNKPPASLTPPPSSTSQHNKSAPIPTPAGASSSAEHDTSVPTPASTSSEHHKHEELLEPAPVSPREESVLFPMNLIDGVRRGRHRLQGGPAAAAEADGDHGGERATAAEVVGLRQQRDSLLLPQPWGPGWRPPTPWGPGWQHGEQGDTPGGGPQAAYPHPEAGSDPFPEPGSGGLRAWDVELDGGSLSGTGKWDPFPEPGTGKWDRFPGAWDPFPGSGGLRAVVRRGDHLLVRPGAHLEVYEPWCDVVYEATGPDLSAPATTSACATPTTSEVGEVPQSNALRALFHLPGEPLREDERPETPQEEEAQKEFEQCLSRFPRTSSVTEMFGDLHTEHKDLRTRFGDPCARCANLCVPRDPWSEILGSTTCGVIPLTRRGSKDQPPRQRSPRVRVPETLVEGGSYSD